MKFNPAALFAFACVFLAFTSRSADFFDILQPSDRVVATSANSPAGQGATNATDHAATSKYLNYDKINAGFTVYPAISNVPIHALGLISAGDAPERDPARFNLYGSNDGTNFNLVARGLVPAFIGRYAFQSFGFANVSAYSVYKILFPSVQDPALANSMQIAEVELLPYADIITPGYSLLLQLPSGATLNSAGGAGALLDRQVGSDANKLVVLNVSNNVTAVIRPYGGASIAKGFELVGGNDDATYPEREPSSFKLEGSNDGVNFTVLATVTPQSPTANMQIQGFSTAVNTSAFTVYRATFGPPRSGTVLQVGELRIFGITSPGLTIFPSGANQLLLWPASGFTLQLSSNLVNWVTAPDSPIVTNGQSQAIVPRTATNGFYRLKSQ